LKKRTEEFITAGYYIKARKIQESKIAHAPPHVREIWDWFLMQANHKDRKVGGTVIKRGQVFTSYEEIRNALHWMVGWDKRRYKKSHLETTMKWLRKHAMVTTRKTTRGMLITIVNYDFYQNPENYKATGKSTGEPQGKLQEIRHYKQEGKKGTNKNNIIDRIYQTYPLKAGKKKALQAIEKALKEKPFEYLLERTEVYREARMINGKAAEYTLHPATFFNGGHYDDDPETWRINDRKENPDFEYHRD